MEFLQRYKTILFVLGFVAIVCAMAFALYSLFFKPLSGPLADGGTPAATSTATGFPDAGDGGAPVGTDTEGGVLPDTAGGDSFRPTTVSPVARGGLTKTTPLTADPGLGAALAANGRDLQFYNEKDGKFYRLSKTGELVALSDRVFHKVEAVTWSPTMGKAILEFPDGANIVYDFERDEQVTLPAHWEDFEFSRSGDEIVMKSIGLDPKNRWLAVASNDGTNIRSIEALGENGDRVIPSWSPNNQTVAMYTEGTSFDRQELYFLGLNNENFRSTTIEGRGFLPLWSPTGDILLYSVYSSDTDMKPMLWVVGASGEAIGTNRRSLDLATWADKCAFADNRTVYCGVPESLEAGSGLFPELGLESKDRLYKIDIATGLKTLVAIPDGAYNMSRPVVSDDSAVLYFTDARSKRLYAIQLN